MVLRQRFDECIELHESLENSHDLWHGAKVGDAKQACPDDLRGQTQIGHSDLIAVAIGARSGIQCQGPLIGLQGQHREMLQPGSDIVVIVRTGADKLSYRDVESELGSLLLDVAPRDRED